MAGSVHQLSFLNQVVNNVQNQLSIFAPHSSIDIGLIRFHVNRLNETLLNGQDYQAMTSNDDSCAAPMDTLPIKIDIIALASLIKVSPSLNVTNITVALRIILQQAVKVIEEANVMELFYSKLILECLSNSPYSITPSKQCEFIHLLASSTNEFENDISNGILDLIRQGIKNTTGFNHQTNRHTNPELNSVLLEIDMR